MQGIARRIIKVALAGLLATIFLSPAQASADIRMPLRQGERPNRQEVLQTKSFIAAAMNRKIGQEVYTAKDVQLSRQMMSGKYAVEGPKTYRPYGGFEVFFKLKSKTIQDPQRGTVRFVGMQNYFSVTLPRDSDYKRKGNPVRMKDLKGMTMPRQIVQKRARAGSPLQGLHQGQL